MEFINSELFTKVIVPIVSFLLGGIGGYKIGVTSKNKQVQKAGAKSNQHMTSNHNMSIDNINNSIVNQANGDVVNKNAK